MPELQRLHFTHFEHYRRRRRRRRQRRAVSNVGILLQRAGVAGRPRRRQKVGQRSRHRVDSLPAVLRGIPYHFDAIRRRESRLRGRNEVFNSIKLFFSTIFTH